MNKTETNSKTKTLIAFVTIAMAIAALILGFTFRTPVMDTFSAGTWLSFVAFLFSLASVKNYESNALPMLAFSLLGACATGIALLLMLADKKNGYGLSKANIHLSKQERQDHKRRRHHPVGRNGLRHPSPRPARAHRPCHHIRLWQQPQPP